MRTLIRLPASARQRPPAPPGTTELWFFSSLANKLDAAVKKGGMCRRFNDAFQVWLTPSVPRFQISLIARPARPSRYVQRPAPGGSDPLRAAAARSRDAGDAPTRRTAAIMPNGCAKQTWFPTFPYNNG
ncbi:unnamed protein product [Chrysodeixis includens]|uniref:Uncharacterized protein n=1 Tax=Chrysodeixis includens TaxID=689277 RepID=A0A9N8PYP9_CHRIL|nr:unnamed protein product [Chrysodeixis includens]